MHLNWANKIILDYTSSDYVKENNCKSLLKKVSWPDNIFLCGYGLLTAHVFIYESMLHCYGLNALLLKPFKMTSYYS